MPVPLVSGPPLGSEGSPVGVKGGGLGVGGAWGGQGWGSGDPWLLGPVSESRPETVSGPEGSLETPTDPPRTSR